MIRIILEPTELKNVGDAAMLEVAVKRLRAIWPNANIQYFGEPSETLRHELGVESIPTSGRHLWFEEPFLDLGPLVHLSSGPARFRSWCERLIRRRWPSLARRLLTFRLRHRGRAEEALAVDRFYQAVRHADLAFACGMGGLSDAFPHYARELLGTMELTVAHGGRTALVGQGIGPLEDPGLMAEARRVLPLIDLIALREGRLGPDLLRSLHVREYRILVTGDEAIELAFERRRALAGGGVGVNLRVAPYSGIRPEVVDHIARVLHDFLEATGARPVPIPISHAPGDADADTISKLLMAEEPTSDGGRTLTQPMQVIERVADCRIVMTGSYHAAVFSLSMGIPAVGLVGSHYYAQKFLGLQHQFGGGCEVVPVEGPDWTDRLATALHRAWEEAPRSRPELLDAAATQIAAAHEAYRRIEQVVGSSTTKSGAAFEADVR